MHKQSLYTKNIAWVQIAPDNMNFWWLNMEDFKKKRIFRAIIVVLIGAFIFWQISLLFVSRNRMKEDGEEIMEFMKQAEESTQQKFWSIHDLSPFTDPNFSYLCKAVVKSPPQDQSNPDVKFISQWILDDIWLFSVKAYSDMHVQDFFNSVSVHQPILPLSQVYCWLFYSKFENIFKSSGQKRLASFKRRWRPVLSDALKWRYEARWLIVSCAL